MRQAAWIIAIIGSVFGGLTLLLTFMSADSAPQEAAGAALALGLAAIPYCFARAISEAGAGRSN